MKRSEKWIHSPECDEAMAFYVAGHSVRETAEKFGVTTVQINNVVKRRGLTNGRSWRQGSKEYDKKLKKEAEARLEAILESKGFVYCGGYTDRDGKVEIACKTCGAKFTRTLPIIYHGSLVCLKCKSITHRQELKRLNEERKEQKRIEFEQQKREREASKAEALFHLLNDKTHICTVCGKSFSIADYMEDCGLKQIQRNPSYCSNACKRRLNHRKSKECKKRSGNFDRGNHRHRARKYGVAYEPGITLKKVFKRDNGICQICGKPCDWSDRGWNKYCGPLYPSIDHIIPLDKGGGHVWENVQLAHMMCNSEKGDKLLKAVIS